MNSAELDSLFALEPRFRVGRIAVHLGAAPGTVRDWLASGRVTLSPLEFMPGSKAGQMHLVNTIGVYRLAAVHYLTSAGQTVAKSAAGAELLVQAIFGLGPKRLPAAKASGVMALLSPVLLVVDHSKGNEVRMISTMDWLAKMPLDVVTVVRIGRLTEGLLNSLIQDEESRIVSKVQQHREYLDAMKAAVAKELA